VWDGARQAGKAKEGEGGATLDDLHAMNAGREQSMNKQSTAAPRKPRVKSARAPALPSPTPRGVLRLRPPASPPPARVPPPPQAVRWRVRWHAYEYTQH
jgi:hypothetical protein